MERRRGFMVEETVRGAVTEVERRPWWNEWWRLWVLVKLREKRKRDHIWFLENEEYGRASVDEEPIPILRSRCRSLFCYSWLWKT